MNIIYKSQSMNVIIVIKPIGIDTIVGNNISAPFSESLNNNPLYMQITTPSYTSIGAPSYIQTNMPSYTPINASNYTQANSSLTCPSTEPGICDIPCCQNCVRDCIINGGDRKQCETICSGRSSCKEVCLPR